jgi:flagellar hook-associated protein 1
MPGLFDTLSLATRALEAQQVGVQVTGQNLANANNPAYARQRVDLATSDPIQTALGMQGTGVQVAAIQQVRDALLDGQVRDESSVGGFWLTQQSALGNLETELGEFLSGSTTDVSGTGAAGSSQGLSTQLNKLFTAFQTLAASPQSASARLNLVSQAQALAETLNQITSRLDQVQSNLNTSVSDDVASANQLLSEIAQLNTQITKAEAGTTNTANDLRDSREQKLEALAKVVNFQSSVSSGGTLSISIGGVGVVSGGAVLDTLQTYSGSGGQLLVRTASSATPLTLSGGSIQGAIDTRDGALANLRTGLDGIASSLISQVNTLYRPGYSLNGTTGADFFTGSDASTIGVNSTLQTDPSLIQAAGVPGAAGDNRIALALGQLAAQPNAALGNQTFSEAYSQVVMRLGAALSKANDQVSNHQTVATLLANQRDSVSGVSMEEEMTNLVTFQRAYQASAQVMTTVNQMLQTLVNLKSS